MPSEAKPSRRPRTEADLKQELTAQLALLLNACKSFDGGLRAIGKHIALSLRVLLHEHRQSKALLRQLGLLDKRFMDSGGVGLNPTNVTTECTLVLVSIRAGPAGASFEPLCKEGGGPYPPRWRPFAEWWNMPIIKDHKHRTFSRRELVLHVADTDGGAHVDAALDDAYMALSRENSLEWNFSDGQRTIPLGGPEMPCMRQIAHEVLETLKAKGVTASYP